MTLAAISLDDKYQSEHGQVYLTGSQALVRAAMMQYLRDQAAGLNTASFISGYRGSPMHNIDKELWRANRFLAERAIHFVPGINEDLAATACLGTQQVCSSWRYRSRQIRSNMVSKVSTLALGLEVIGVSSKK
jgi:indolepyruvate ferredoxin oxidoreductase